MLAHPDSSNFPLSQTILKLFFIGGVSNFFKELKGRLTVFFVFCLISRHRKSCSVSLMLTSLLMLPFKGFMSCTTSENAQNGTLPSERWLKMAWTDESRALSPLCQAEFISLVSSSSIAPDCLGSDGFTTSSFGGSPFIPLPCVVLAPTWKGLDAPGRRTYREI